jgi:hypothetical protein
MNRWGHLGVAYWQRFDRTFDWRETPESPLVLNGEGGAFEGVASYSLAIPGVRGLAFGAAIHALRGKDRIYFQETVDLGDDISTYVRRDSIEVQRQATYPSLSGYYTHGDFDIGGWFDFSGDLRTETHRGATDQRFSSTVIKTGNATPWGYGVSGAWRVSSRHQVVGSFSYADWTAVTSDATQALKGGLGWQFKGKGDRFDNLWKRTDLRLGGFYSTGGIGDPYSFGATSGVGIPLGNYGQVDFGAQAGRTFAGSGNEQLQDDFIRLYVSLSGGSLWGQSQRQRR